MYMYYLRIKEEPVNWWIYSGYSAGNSSLKKDFIEKYLGTILIITYIYMLLYIHVCMCCGKRPRLLNNRFHYMAMKTMTTNHTRAVLSNS